MHIGIINLGKISKGDGDYIATKFVIVVIPLFPLNSFYATQNEARIVNEIKIPLSARSIFKGYLQLYSFVAFVVFLIFAMIPAPSTTIQDTLILLSIAGIALGVCIWLTFFFARIGSRELKRRQYLKLATGIGAPPHILPHDLVSKILTDINDKATKSNLPIAIDQRPGRDLSRHSLSLILANAIYLNYMQPDRGWDRLEDKAWQAIEAIDTE